MSIQYIHAKPSKDADYWYDGAGFYFSDEAYTLQGPYDTHQQAKEAETAYAEWLNEGG